MHFDMKFPIGGDVLFYTSNSPHGLAIEHAQRKKGFSNPELMHAAIMVDSRVLTQSNVKKGVHYVSVFETEQIYSENIPPVVLRHPELANARSVKTKIWPSSFYFYNQKYDFSGALSMYGVSEKAKICSTLVLMILSRLDEFSSVAARHGNFQIYPAQLFGLLKDAGFQEIGPYDEPRKKDFGRSDDLTMLTMLEQHRTISNIAADIGLQSFPPASSQEDILSQFQSSAANEQIRLLIFPTLLFNQSILASVKETLDTSNSKLNAYRKMISKQPANWEDETIARETVAESRKGLVSTINLAGRELAALTDFLDRGLGEFWGNIISVDDVLFQDSLAIFTMQFLNAGSETADALKESETLYNLAKKCTLAKKDDKLTAYTKLHQAEDTLMNEALRLKESINKANARNMETSKSEPKLYKIYIDKADVTISNLRKQIESELSIFPDEFQRVAIKLNELGLKDTGA